MSFKPPFSLSPFTFIKRLFSSSSLSAIRVVSSAFLRLLIFLLAILIPACVSSSPAFLIMYSAYKLNKQGDNIQLWHTPFPIWNQSVVPCLIITVAFWSARRFLRGQVRWSGVSISFRIFQFVVIHTVKGFGIFIKAEVFLVLSCFFNDPSGVGNLISGSSAFSKTSLSICKFTVHLLLKSGLENFEHYFANMWGECNCMIVWAFFCIVFLWDWMKSDFFHSCGLCWVFQICWHIECSTFIALLSLRIWNRLTGIPSSPLALFVEMLPKARLTSHSRLSVSRRVITPLWLSGSWRSFLYSSVYSCHLFLISSASVMSILFLSFIMPIFAWNFPWYL